MSRYRDPFIPLSYSLEVEEMGAPTLDRFGNEIPAAAHWVPRKVAMWALTNSLEETEDSVLRTVDRLQVHFRLGEAPDPAARIRLPDGTVWQVEGNPSDYNHGPWWAPGLVCVYAKKVEG